MSSPPYPAPSPAPKYVSLGYRCSSAGILKRLGLKTESFPFDWMVSRLPIIEHCIATHFVYLVDPANYTKKQTHITHYHRGTTPTPRKIADETVYENHYYETQHPEFRQLVSTQIPRPLSVETGDTYASLCVINHRNILEEDTQSYYARCVSRWSELSPSHVPTHVPPHVHGLYIHPTMTEPEYSAQRETLVAEFLRFKRDVLPEWTSILFFIMVRTEHPYPITQYVDSFLEIVAEDAGVKIVRVYTNEDFIDAGEIFMQNAYIETDAMCHFLRSEWNPPTR